MQNQSSTQISGLDKAAQLLMLLPKAESAQVISLLPQHHAEKITMEIIRPERKALTPEQCAVILGDARQEMQARSYVSTGGVPFARSLLSEAYGPERAEEILSRLIATVEAQPFYYLNEIEPPQVATVLQEEPPQAIALILSYLALHTASAILAALPASMQGEVIKRVSDIQPVAPAVIKRMEESLKKRVASLINDEQSHQQTGGVDFVVRALQQAGVTTERNVLEWLDEKAPDLSVEIRKKMFVFDNITTLDDRSTQRILREVDTKDLGVAMRGAGPEVREHILRNLSSRAGEQLRDELDTGAPIRRRLVEEAQQRIVGIIRKLEEAEEITVARGGGEDAFV